MTLQQTKILPRRLRCAAALGVMALLAACATQPTRETATVEAAQYAARARSNYTPPGPPQDPWGPYIREAAARFNMPDQWIRAVMHQESGGRLYEYGTLITSPTGAMGLMQVEPYTYDELRARYGLGADPYDPQQNILAGTAYMRELYDAYGAPAFLAAYNAGPGRLDDYLANRNGLPAETRHYVAVIAPNLWGVQPQRVSEAQQVALNQIPIDIPPGPRYPRHNRSYEGGYALAQNRPRGNGRGSSHGYPHSQVLTASALPLPPLPLPPLLSPPPRTQLASAVLPHTLRHNPGGFHLISRAMADTLPVHSGGPATGAWAVQVGAFGNAGQARAVAQAARGHAGLAEARVEIGSVHQGHAVLYRARLVGVSHEAATQACGRLSHRSCIVLSPSAQS